MNKQKVTHTVEISPRTFFTLLLLGAGIWFFVTLYELVFAVFLAFIIASFFTPVYEFLQAKRVHKIVAILGIYAFSFGLISLLIFTAARPLVNQFENLVSFLNEKFPFLSQYLALNADTNPIQFLFSLQNLSNVIPGISSAFGVLEQTSWTILIIIITIVISGYLLIYKEGFASGISQYMPHSMKKDIVILMERIEKNLGAWMNGQLLLGVIIGICSYIGMLIFDVRFAPTLGVLGGILEIIPGIGPVIFAAVSLSVAFADGKSVLILAGIALWNFFIQQAESAFIVPKVMQRAVGINPIIVILSIVSGFKLFGVLGGLLGVPFVVIVKVILDYYLIEKRKKG